MNKLVVPIVKVTATARLLPSLQTDKVSDPKVRFDSANFENTDKLWLSHGFVSSLRVFLERDASFSFRETHPLW